MKIFGLKLCMETTKGHSCVFAILTHFCYQLHLAPLVSYI